MSPGSRDSLERMTPAELIGLVRRLIGEVGRLRAEHEKLSEAVAGLRVEKQTLKDEIARLKALPPRPPHKPSGMEKGTDRPEGGAPGDEETTSKRRRGPGVSKLSIDRRVTLTVEAPAGSRHKGYEDIIGQDLMLKAETTLYLRERSDTPEGERPIAPLDARIVGATRARRASPPPSAPTGSPRSAPGPANPAWLSSAVCSPARRPMGSTRGRSPTCAAPICRGTSSRRSPAMRRSSSARARNRSITCAPSASPVSGRRPI